ncbi:class I SAM-dependent methyltransferase [Nocardia australiensis]|uniref:class I SAM-dependent methyltransferase n=1 Tax=Nocardia australiensis TaxID=2887191 RepID=UPI001D14EDA9|nr:class I SAM-dependent methyltransferase [Nocardia australiensis]
MTNPRDADATRFATASLADGDPTGWFEPLYAAAEAGSAVVPWDTDSPNPLLVDWTERHEPAGVGGRALVVGSGLGRDSEHVARQGFRTIAFDISETAVRTTRERFPNSPVDYVVADLLDPPAEWTGAFDLVVESITVQSMPLSVRTTAIANIARMVAPDGELLVISGIRVEGEHVAGPPWPLTRAEVEAFALDGLVATRIEKVSLPTRPDAYWWRAWFRRR